MPWVKMPDHVVSRARKNGCAFYFIVRHGRPDGWPATIPLGTDEAHAIKRAATLNAELAEARLGMQRGPARHSLPWLLNDYEASPEWARLKPSTQRSYLHCSKLVREWAMRTKGGREIHLRTVTPPDVLRFLAQFEATPTKRRHLAAFLSVIFEHARLRGLTNHNPARRLKLRTPRKQTALWAPEDVAAVMAEAERQGRSSVALAVLIGYWTSQRVGDVLALQKPRDYAGGRFRLVQQKTGQEVFLPAAAPLRAALDALPREQLVLVVNEKTGRAYNHRVFDRYMRAALLAAGRGHLRFHGLRHTAVTDALIGGATTRQAMGGSGHQNEATIGTYARRVTPLAEAFTQALERSRAAQESNASVECVSNVSPISKLKQ